MKYVQSYDSYFASDYDEGIDDSTPDAWDDYWYNPVGHNYDHPEIALRVSAVFACIRVLSESVAMLPCRFWEFTSDNGDRREAREHPTYEILMYSPNEYQTAFEFWECFTAWFCFDGNAFAVKKFAPNGQLQALHPLQSNQVKVVDLGERIGFIWTNPVNGEQFAYTQDEMFYAPFMVIGKDKRGISPLRYAYNALKLSLSAEQYGVAFFTNGGRPSGVLEAPQGISQDEHDRMRKGWERLHNGPKNAYRVAILEHGTKYREIGVPNKDAQLLELRVFEVRDIARIFRVPLHMIGDYERSTFSNIEHLSLEFVSYTLTPYLSRFEQRIRKNLITQKTRYTADFDVESLMRTDTQTRMAFFSSGLQNGYLSRNEVRRRLGLNSVPNGNEFYQQANLLTPGSAEWNKERMRLKV